MIVVNEINEIEEKKKKGRKPSTTNYFAEREEEAVRNYAETHKVSIGDALAVFKGVGNKDAQLRLTAAHYADQALGTGGMATQYMALLNSKKPEDREKAKTMRQELINDYLNYANSGSSIISPPPTSGLPETHTTKDGQKLYLHKDGKYYTTKPS